MNRAEQQELLEKAVSSRLSSEEKRKFELLVRTDAAFAQLWEEEKALEEALQRLPAAVLSSNFTTQVLRIVDREQSRGSERRRIVWWRNWSWARIGISSAVAGLAVVLGVIQYQQHQRTQMAESLSAISDVTTVFSPAEPDPVLAAEILQDFDAIARLSSFPSEAELDMELLVALQR